MKLQAVLFDWAGTTVDYGSRAPTEVFLEVFRQREVEISEAEARAPMGLAKRDHIAAVARTPRVAEAWQTRYGNSPTDADVDRMYAEFLPLQKQILARGCDVIPGIVEAVGQCRERGMKIGSTTGYTRELMDVVVPLAADNGYAPDAVVCSDEVAAGRPAPWMNFRAAERLGVYPMESVVAVDDTVVGIEAGLNAGCRTVGISQTGNALGLSEAQVDALDPDELTARLEQITAQFLAAGADMVLRSAAELPQVLEQLAGGE